MTLYQQKGAKQMAIAKYIVFSLLGFGGGIVISGAVFAFIAIIGVVPRLAQKSHTEKYIKLYEEAIIWGGILGASCLLFPNRNNWHHYIFIVYWYFLWCCCSFSC